MPPVGAVQAGPLLNQQGAPVDLSQRQPQLREAVGRAMTGNDVQPLIALARELGVNPHDLIKHYAANSEYARNPRAANGLVQRIGQQLEGAGVRPPQQRQGGPQQGDPAGERPAQPQQGADPISSFFKGVADWLGGIFKAIFKPGQNPAAEERTPQAAPRAQ